MKMPLALLAIVISLLSLGLQLKGQKPVPPFEKFLIPARMSELEHRMERANVTLSRDAIVISHGIGVPFVRELTTDHQHIIVRVIVSEENLPKTYDERKKELWITAVSATITVAYEFDLKSASAGKLPSEVIVQFVDIGGLAKKENAEKIYAEFKDNELTFH